MTCGVYAIVYARRGQLYVGSSRAIESRWYMHQRMFRLGLHWNRWLQAIHDKHGAGALQLIVLEECIAEVRVVVEQSWLDSLPAERLLNLSRIARCPESTAAVRASRSRNAKRLHAEGRLGQAAWKTTPAEVGRKAAATRKLRGTSRAPTFEWTPERRARVSAAMKARRARERRE